MNFGSCFIFDLDGTICDVRHRRQFVATKPRNWDAWNAGLVNDKPIQPIKKVFDALKAAYPYMYMIIVSGRSDDYKEQTETWLAKYGFNYDLIYMRKEGDHRDDAVVKGEIADKIQKRYEIVGVFDDRKRVVDMWTKRGIWVFDCGQGKGDF